MMRRYPMAQVICEVMARKLGVETGKIDWSIPYADKTMAERAAILAERMTGDTCLLLRTPEYHGRYIVSRTDPAGKEVTPP